MNVLNNEWLLATTSEEYYLELINEALYKTHDNSDITRHQTQQYHMLI